MSAENFPTDVRTTAMGLMAASGRIGSVLAQFANTYLISVSITLLLVVSSIMMLGGGVLSKFSREGSGLALTD